MNKISQDDESFFIISPVGIIHLFFKTRTTLTRTALKKRKSRR